MVVMRVIVITLMVRWRKHIKLLRGHFVVTSSLHKRFIQRPFSVRQTETETEEWEL